MILAAVLTVMGAATALAQGIVVNKTDGSKVYFKASEVVSVTTYGYGEDGPHAPAGAEAVDLGLPSGTKWANMNVGAEKPEDYGLYFAWGETQEKSCFAPSTYQFAYVDDEKDGLWYDYGHFYNASNIGSDIAGTGYDAATANWGMPWRMPSQAQIQELIDNCSSECTAQNGVSGLKFVGPSGGTIFLPASGWRYNSEFFYTDTRGSYWSSTLNEDKSVNAFYLYFVSDYRDLDDLNGRFIGRCVRPVR